MSAANAGAAAIVAVATIDDRARMDRRDSMAHLIGVNRSEMR